MLDYADTPYEYFPPRPSRFWIGLFKLYNRFVYLPGAELRIRGVDVSCDPGWEQLSPEARRRCLFVPNHGTHADPQLLMETLRQQRCTSCFMAAYDVFQRDAFRAWIMQRSGAFSVDREGSDKQAMKTALEILKAGQYGLTVFAEGNVYLQNDRVTPFLDGTAFIGLKAQKELGADHPVYVIPVSMKATHARDDAREVILQHLRELAEVVGTELDSGVPIATELERIGILLLHQILERKEMGIALPDGLSLPERLDRVAEHLIAALETAMAVTPREGEGLLNRFRKLRRDIHQIRLDPEKADQHEQAASWAVDAILAFRVLSYSGDYLGESPSLDRVGETVEKLCEDHYSRQMAPFGIRQGLVHLGAPIDLRDWMDRYAKAGRQAMQDLTSEMEQRVQAGLDLLNAGNRHPGGRPFGVEA